MYSAKKVEGKKLYELARKGVTVERKAVPVNIYDIKLKSFDENGRSFFIDVTCSKGTYIRSLSEDIGEKLGCGACLGSLVRTRSGMFGLAGAVRLGDLQRASDIGKADDFLLPVERAFPYGRLEIRPESVLRAENGNSLVLDDVIGFYGIETKYWLYNRDRLVGLYRAAKTKNDYKFHPEVMML
jgi:tRNA pseudouridine55 synthase